MEFKISRDIRSYKPRDIGPFTFKEFGFIVLGIGAGILTWYLTKSIEIAFAPMAIILVFGFLRPCKMSMYQFLRTVGRDALTPRIYVWQSEGDHSEEDLSEDTDSELEENILRVAQPLPEAPCEIEKEDRALLFK